MDNQPVLPGTLSENQDAMRSQCGLSTIFVGKILGKDAMRSQRGIPTIFCREISRNEDAMRSRCGLSII